MTFKCRFRITTLISNIGGRFVVTLRGYSECPGKVSASRARK